MVGIEYILYWVLGIVAGLLAGLLGVGGGAIIVPALFFIFYKMGFDHFSIMSFCAATSLSAMIITGMISSISHIRKKGFDWSIIASLVPGLLVGAICGVFVSTRLHGSILAKIFGIVILVLGIYLFFPKFPEFRFGKFSQPKKIILSYGLGFLSALLGIGGGVFAVPLLMGFELSFRKSAAISSAITFIIALIGTTGYLIVGWNHVTTPLSLGYIYLPAFFLISFGTVISSPIGVRLTYILPKEILKKIFSIVLIMTAIVMLFH